MFNFENMSTFSERLNKALKHRGISRPQFTKMVGMSRGNATHWFGGRASNPTGELVAKAAEVLRVNARWLASDEGAMSTTVENGVAVAEAPAINTQHDETSRESERMNLRQQQHAMARLMENIPQTARDKLLEDAVRKALEEKWIDHIPDDLMTAWSAKEKIEEIKARAKRNPNGEGP